MAKDSQLIFAKQAVLENLDTIQMSLVRCVQEGMIDLEDSYYNEVLGLIEEGRTADNWDELMEAVVRAKTLENDVASWMSRHGRNSVSLTWPKQPKIK